MKHQKSPSIFLSLCVAGLFWSGCSEPEATPPKTEEPPKKTQPPHCVGQGKGDIYGFDDRSEAFQARPGLEQNLARASAALVNLEDIKELTDENGFITGYGLSNKVQSVKEFARLCEDQRFREQPMLAACSMTLVAPDLVLTAGHCLSLEMVPQGVPGDELDQLTQCRSRLIMFDFAYENQDAADAGGFDIIPAENTYACKRIEAFGYAAEPESIDWALVRLDRPVTDRTPVPMLAVFPEIQAEILQIGHPTRIPQKLSRGRVIDDNNFPYAASFEGNSFTYEADLFGGDSGGGVFDVATGTIAGVPSRYSAQDYVWNEAKECTDYGVCGETVECIYPPGAFATAKMLEYLTEQSPELLAELNFFDPNAEPIPEPDAGNNDDMDAGFSDDGGPSEEDSGYVDPCL